jgi:myo-inositol-hexaphosphate 3-phosphohydrolase/phosphodiesterase/alkaline phosphatase D-like protein
LILGESAIEHLRLPHQLSPAPTPVKDQPMAPTIRFSQFNASLNRNSEGQLVTDLSTPNNAQAKAVAEIIQRTNPDVLLINEFDYFTADPTAAIRLLLENYLGVSQNGATPVEYPYFYIAPSNTGIATGFDLNNNGVAVTTPETPGYGDDSFGFGQFPGQFGMLLLSKYPIDTDNIRTFQTFLWKDMPGNLLTNDPTVDNPATPVNENLGGFYSAEEQAILRLSSKSHWDVPILVNGETIHALVSHPTPPVFDGTEDRNGKRNYDEIRFWSDYVTPGKGSYIYDDEGGTGGLTAGSKFVIMGDQNADPNDGDSYNNAVRQLLQNPNINTNTIPSSLGGVQQAALQGGANATHKSNPAFDTGDFADTTPGNLRTDYVLPSANQQIASSGVFWPLNTDPNFAPVGVFTPSLPGGYPSSDHRLVYTDIQLGATEAGKTVVGEPSSLGQTIVATGTVPAGAAGTINGTPVPLGGLSGVAYDAAKNQYYAISDDRSENGPARFYTFTANPSTLGTAGVTFTNVTALKDTSGNTFARFSLDPEDIVLTKNGTVFISSEGEVRPDLGASRVTDPFIKEFNLTTGQEIRSLAIPTKFLPKIADTNGDGVVNAGDTQTAGVRNNLAFESLTITPDQKTLFTATENALFQDGPVAGATTTSASRIIQYNLVNGQPEKEYLYEVDKVAIAPPTTTSFNTNGLVDLLAIDNRGTFLAVERSFTADTVGTGNTIKIYEITLQGATDISVYDSLSSLTTAQRAAIQPVQKRLVLNLDDLKLSTGLDNIEGIEFGPKLADGRQSIVLVSDNNFSATQFTQILALSADLVPTVAPIIETQSNFNDDSLPFSQRVDSDDPAIYVNAQDAGKSLILTAVKNGGLQIYDLAGNLLQTVNPGNIRYNNVDLIYGFELNGQKVDLAIASDRNNDKLVIFQINPNGAGGQYVTDITSSSIGTLFQAEPFLPPYSASTRSAYGIAGYTSPVNGDSYAFVNRRQTGDVAQFKLVDMGNGTVGATLVREFTIPLPVNSPAGTSPQTEGMVVDQQTGFLYIGQEDVGIWKFYAEPNGGRSGILIDRVSDLGGKNLVADVEGLTIYYGADGTGYLLASSQGDNTFAVYSREGNNDFIGRFAVGNNGSIDSVQESDGAAVISVPLGPNFPFGAFITQDGDNLPGKFVDGENINTNFKFVPWENIANAFSAPLTIDTTSYDPRRTQAESLLNGIASGDTTQTSTVLWTRSNFVGKVTFEYSTDANFSHIEGTKTSFVLNPLQPVKVDVTGLNPNTTYYYRATDAAGDTAIGQFKTSATLGTYTGLTFGVTGDWQQAPPFPSLGNADTANLEFFLKLGDTIYADAETPALPGITQARTLNQFRIKQEENVSSRFGLNTVRDLYASTSILATIDDHEVVDNFAGGARPGESPDAPDIGSSPDRLFTDAVRYVNDTRVYEDALQAFQEYHPLRNEFYGNTGDDRTAGERKLYRANSYGSDAAMFVLDTRSFRDVQLAPASLANPVPFLVNAFDPTRTLLGRQQVTDLKRDLLAAETNGITWKFIAVPEPIQNFGVINAEDRFEGYAAERTEILKFINDNNISNVVFLSGDFHGTLVNNLTYQLAPGQAQIQTSAFEIVTGPAAFFDGLFGPTVAQLSLAANLITPEQFRFYQSLPVAPDADDVVNDRDDFIKQLLVAQTSAFGYDPIGLQGSLIDATLLQGDYVSTHTYGWTQFDIDQTTQKLTVTTYGVPAYSEAELLANPSAVTSLTPRVVSQFEVNPGGTLNGTAGDDTLIGGAANERIFGNEGDDFLYGGAGNDTLDGGAGYNFMDGGAGRDTFVLSNKDAYDWIGNFELGADVIKLTGGLTFAQLTITQGTANDTFLTNKTTGNRVAVLEGIQATALTSASFV